MAHVPVNDVAGLRNAFQAAQPGGTAVLPRRRTWDARWTRVRRVGTVARPSMLRRPMVRSNLMQTC